MSCSFRKKNGRKVAIYDEHQGNEYSVHFDGMGLSAEDMFNMLANGADAGTFSVDKLGDAVKEFGIRIKADLKPESFETLGMSAKQLEENFKENGKAFELMGLQMEDVVAKFGAGGESAKLALEEITTALFNIQDPIEQNRIGVELFGIKTLCRIKIG